MKIVLNRISGASGHVLIMTLIICSLIALSLGAYLNLIKSQTNYTVRHQVWNASMSLVEAGLEEALAHLNNPSVTSLSQLATDGWTYDASLTGFTKTRNLGDGYFTVAISTNAIQPPIITSSGYLKTPITISTSGGMLATVIGTPAAGYINRTVRAYTKKEPLFVKAFVAREYVDFNGNNVGVDSYNSSVGPYNALLAGDKGDVSVNTELGNSLNVGNANIKGKVTVGPKGVIKIGPNGTVGSVGWHLLGKKGIEPGWSRTDSNFGLPDSIAPWSGGAVTPSGNGTFKYVLDDPDANYELNNLTILAGERMFIRDKCKLWVKGNVDIRGELKVNTAGTLKLYISGPSAVFNGTYDKSLIPADFLIYGLPTLTSIDLATGVQLPAVMYAPDAAVKINGNADFFGSMVAKRITLTGTSEFHYDEALMTYPAFRGYLVAGWQEL